MHILREHLIHCYTICFVRSFSPSRPPVLQKLAALTCNPTGIAWQKNQCNSECMGILFAVQRFFKAISLSVLA